MAQSSADFAEHVGQDGQLVLVGVTRELRSLIEDVDDPLRFYAKSECMFDVLSHLAGSIPCAGRGHVQQDDASGGQTRAGGVDAVSRRGIGRRFRRSLA